MPPDPPRVRPLDNGYFPRYAEHYSTSQKEAELGEHGLDGIGPSHWGERQKSPRTAFGAAREQPPNQVPNPPPHKLTRLGLQRES